MGLFDSFRKKLSSTSGNERSLLSRKIQDSPQDPQARQKLGLFLLRQGEIVEGLDQLARSAILYEKSGFTAKAIAVLRHILKNDPASLEFRRWLIRLLAQHGHTGDALSELQKIAAGGIRFENQEKKIEFLRGISEYLPNSPLPFLLVADVYLYEGSWSRQLTKWKGPFPWCRRPGWRRSSGKDERPVLPSGENPTSSRPAGSCGSPRGDRGAQLS